MRAVANMVRGEQVEKAMMTLQMMPKKAARIINKALVSASANAEDKSGGDVNPELLFIKTITVDEGATRKSWMPRARGTANRINHKTSHLTVVVSDEE